MTETLTILRVDASVRTGDLIRALDAAGLVLTTSEQGLRVTTRAAREVQQLRKPR